MIVEPTINLKFKLTSQKRSNFTMQLATSYNLMSNFVAAGFNFMSNPNFESINQLFELVIFLETTFS